MKKYLPQQFEAKWIEKWAKDKIYKTPDPSTKKGKSYVLDMFPYPSGAGLHVGHPRGYTASDILARFYRMNGKAVLHPMGWDAFGLPAENAAIKAKKNPLDMVPQNIANFKRQMMMLGFSYDWDREFATTDPSYYKWTQWLFIQFFKMGLLYKKNTPINFCPVCKTGLAEEEVLPNGTHERCGNPITKKDLPQWIFRITLYADRLLEDLNRLDWPTGILEMQKNWIGRKEGVNITYPVKNTKESVVCFTTRPDTNYGATFIVLAPDHELVQKILSGQVKVDEKTKDSIEKYVQETKGKTEVERQIEGKQKTGVFTGLYATNRLNNNEIPIWISDFVLANFGAGAVVGVPAHDRRDFDFAHEFGIEVRRVVVSNEGEDTPITSSGQVYEDYGKAINSGILDGMDSKEAMVKITEYLETQGWGEKLVTYHIRDWIFSRQRYWGEPIPMIYCENCAKNKVSFFDKIDEELEMKDKNVEENVHHWRNDVKESLFGIFPLSKDQLPLELPYVQSYEPTDTGESPLSKIDTFVNVKCPHCNSNARRETDTMPNWAGSCWYFLRFVQPQDESAPFTKEKLRELFPVDWYIGGAEHAVLHLLYARFWVKALQDLNLVDYSEPFLRLRNVGMILAEDNRKMSKSFGNVINPDEVVKDFGADALRTYEMFMAPFSQEISWSIRTLQGAYRFLTRVWALYNNEKSFKYTSDDKPLLAKLSKTIQKVTTDIEAIKFNTAIASMMEFINEWESKVNKEEPALTKESALKFLQILAPFAPFITEEIYSSIYNKNESIHLSEWPQLKMEDVAEVEVKIPVQVNGKVRAVIVVPAIQLEKDEVVKAALQDSQVQKHIGNKEYTVIYVKGKILNFSLK